MYKTPTFITEALRLVAYVNDYKSERNGLYSASLLLLCKLVSMVCINAKATSTNNNDYSCRIKAIELV